MFTYQNQHVVICFFGRSVADNKTNHTDTEEFVRLRSTVLRPARNEQKLNISRVKEYFSSEQKLNILRANQI